MKQEDQQNKSRIKFGFVVVFAFFVGFFTHALFFSYMFVDGKDLEPKVNLKTLVPEGESDTGFFTRIDFQNGEFTPAAVRMRYGDYITITNRNDKDMMWLVSNEPKLNTVRNYGKSEQLKTILSEKGTYEVFEKNNPDAKLVIYVR